MKYQFKFINNYLYKIMKSLYKFVYNAFCKNLKNLNEII